MNIIAIDDEELSLMWLKSLVSKIVPDANYYQFVSGEDSIEFLKTQSCDVALVDIMGMDLSGVEIAKTFREICPKINIIFVTGNNEYAIEAFGLNASGYLLKPIKLEALQNAFNSLRFPIENEKKLYFKCFGNFEVFYGGIPIKFKREKTKEMLALLYDKRGAVLSGMEIMSYLWEDDDHESYLKQIRKDLADTFEELHIEQYLIKQHTKIGIAFDETEGDYIDFLRGTTKDGEEYYGEYMNQYSWAEETNAYLFEKANKGK